MRAVHIRWNPALTSYILLITKTKPITILIIKKPTLTMRLTRKITMVTHRIVPQVYWNGCLASCAQVETLSSCTIGTRKSNKCFCMFSTVNDIRLTTKVEYWGHSTSWCLSHHELPTRRSLTLILLGFWNSELLQPTKSRWSYFELQFDVWEEHTNRSRCT